MKLHGKFGQRRSVPPQEKVSVMTLEHGSA